MAPAPSSEGELTFKPALPKKAPTIPTEATYDVVKVCKAIAVAETSGCTDGTAIKRFNCHGIMAWKMVDGVKVRYPRYFKSHAESFAACEELWARAYGRLPNLDLAIKYTGGDDSVNWLANFYSAYNKL